MADLLIDLGIKWGNIVPLSVLEHITHIQVLETSQIEVVCEFEKDSGRKAFRFRSRSAFHDEELQLQQIRLLGFSNGIISRADMETIIQSMEAQSGVSAKLILQDITYDISMIRQIWSSMNGEPYFRFILHYDVDTQQVMVDNNHNEEFLSILPDWLDDRTLQMVQSIDERLLMFAYEVMSRLVEPLLPEPEDGAFMDPNAHIPMMGGVVGSTTQRIDLANIGPEQIMGGTG